MKTYNSKYILESDDLYDLQDSFCCSCTPFKYQLTNDEIEWCKFIKGRYGIADYIYNNSDNNFLLTFNSPIELSDTLKYDGMPYKAVMLSDETALQKLFFWLSIND